MNKTFTRVLGVVLSAVMVTTSVSAAVPAVFNAETMPLAYAAQANSAINTLKVNAMATPLGIDTPNPTFSWMLNLDGYGRGQSSYRVIVASTPEKAANREGDLWDSKQVFDPDNYNVVYQGADLTSKTQYYWAVEVWDETGSSLGWSDVATFETAIMTTEEWQGEWIGHKVQSMSPDGGKWIWLREGAAFENSPGGHMYFRKHFTPAADKTVSRVMVGFTADDKVTLYVNGTECGYNGSWSTGTLVDVTDKIVAGDNVLAYDAINDTNGYAGLLSKVKIDYTDGTSDEFVTDDNGWLVSKSNPDGWTNPNFEDADWKAPDQTDKEYGVGPWNRGAVFKLNDPNERAATVLRKEFTADKGEIQSARAYISGLGFYELRINGQLPDDSVMNPCNTQYTQTIPYCTYDVTSLVQQGANAIGVELGNNFYNETDGVWNWPQSAWRDDPKLRMELVINYKNGESETIVTDQTWKMTRNGPTTTNSIYLGETYDARKELTGFAEPGYDDSAWEIPDIANTPAGKLEAQTMEPIRRTKALKPSNITKLENGSYVVTVPEMLAGWAKLNIKNPVEGEKITITYGEKLNSDGQVQKLGGPDGVNSNWWPTDYNQQDKYICKGDPNGETFEPRFSYKGYQYIQIDNYPGELTADDIICYRTSNDMEITGQFDSSSDLFNRMHQMMMTTMGNNMQGKPTDTPVWEKNGWLGDANVATETFMYNYDFQQMMYTFIETMEDCQDEFGSVPNMVPTQGWGSGNSVVWNSIFVLGVDQLFKSYGNESYITDQYDVMRKQALITINDSKNRGWLWDAGTLADWVSPVGSKEEDQNLGYNESPSEGGALVGTGFAYHMLDVLAQMADRLGKTDDAAEYRAAMANMYEAFNKAYYREDQKCYETNNWSQIGTRTKFRQTSQLVPLAFGLVPEEYEAGVVESLVNDIKEKDYHLSTGCVGSKLILPILTEYGYADVAYRVAEQTTYPSWGFMADRGTSLWEMWETTSRSLGHYFLGTYDEWFYKGIGGIKDMEDGYKTFTIEPTLGGTLTYANTSVKTVRGTVVSNWELNRDNTATFEMNVPVGSTATIILPAKDVSDVTLGDQPVSAEMDGITAVDVVDGKVTITAGSGSYTFVSSIGDVQVEKAVLGQLIDQAKQLVQADYNADAWAIFADVLARAEEVYNSETSNQFDINDAETELRTALSDIKENVSVSRATLKASVAAAESNHFNKVEYKLADYSKYNTAYQAAKRGVSNVALTDDQMIKLANDLDAAVATLKQAPTFTNVALGAEISYSSYFENDDWKIFKLVDGDRKNLSSSGEYTGFTSTVGADRTRDHEEWVALNLGSVQEINAVTFYPACKDASKPNSCYSFPKTFDVLVSADGENWDVVASEENYPVPSYGPLSFTFNTVEAQYVKIHAFHLNPKLDDNNYYYLQLSEMEVYNVVDAPTDFELLMLKKVIDNAVALQGGDEYNGSIPEVQKTFDAALERAQFVYSYDKATRAMVSEAQAALLDAIAQLGFQKGDKTELQKLYDEWKDLDLTPYINGAAKDNFTAALKAAEETLLNENATQPMVDKAYTDLETAAGALQLRATEMDKELLKKVIDYANAQKEEGGDYHKAIESVKKSFDAALENAEKVYAETEVASTQVTEAWTTLMNEIHKLGFIAGDKTKLQADYDIYSQLNLDNYLDGAEKDAFIAALDNALTVLKDGDAMANEVDAADQALIDAANALILKGDKTQLKKAVEEANKFDLNNYVEAGQSEFTAALSAADEVLGNDQATQTMVDEALNTLLEAMLNLRLKADKSLLTAAAEKAAAVDVSLYSEESVARFNAAQEAVNAMLADENLSVENQAAANAAAKELEEAILALEPVSGAAAINGDSTMSTASSSAKTGDAATLPLAMATGIAALAFAGYAVSKKRK